jgi:hypothetical protein
MSEEEEKEERDIIMNLDSYVILDYIKSSVDIILNLKFEEIEKKLLDKNSSTITTNNHKKKGSNRNGEIINESINSPNAVSTSRSNYSNQEGPPKVYEELIQSLEADIRKHIRVKLKEYLWSVDRAAVKVAH